MNSLKRLRNTLIRRSRSRSRRYNVVPEPEPESNHTNGRDFRYTNEYARRGRFDYNTMNHYRYKRPLSRKSLQPFQTNLSKSALAKRRKTKGKHTILRSPSPGTLAGISARPIPGFLQGYRFSEMYPNYH
tara:strand:+ start:148 stop:537 length:390 start_codon:yes stop_codon:yes gene_type:complete